MEETVNPYTTPSSDLTIKKEKNDFELASKGQRFLNMIIDNVFYVIFAIFIGMIIGLVGGEKGIAFIESVPDFVFGFIIVLVYYFIQEQFTGRTIGKLITGTKVVDEEGNKPSAGQIMGRSLVRFVPFEAFSFLGGESRGFHDSWAKTYVIKRQKA